MQKPIDLQVEDFKDELMKFINSNQQIPFSVMVMTMNEMCGFINRQYAQYKQQLQEEYKKQSQNSQEQVSK